MMSRADHSCQPAQYFFEGRYTEALQKLNQNLREDPHSSTLFLNKALYQYSLGHLSQALIDINQALTFDPFNYHAYFNLCSMQVLNGDKAAAFKNLCCALSCCNLLVGQIKKEERYLQRAIELSFNNRDARALRSLMKLEKGSKIDALNQINYALYLDPANVNLVEIQKRVYREMGMKELKALGVNMKKAKFQRLDTCIEVPALEKIDGEMEILMKELNVLVRQIKENEVYIVNGSRITIDPREKIQNKKIAPVQQSSIRWAQIKSVSATPISSVLTTKKAFVPVSLAAPKSPTAPTNPEQSQVEVQQSNALMISIDKDASTQNGSEKGEQLPCDSLQIYEGSKEAFIQEASLQKLDNLSISNISQNSRIKLSRISQKNVLDISDCLVNMLQESSSDKLLDSLNESDSRDNNKLELKLPIESLRCLGANQKIVLAIQRVKVNQKGEKEEMEELYEIVANSKGFELVRSQADSVAV